MPHPSPLLLLAKHFAEGKIDAESFAEQYMNMWRNDANGLLGGGEQWHKADIAGSIYILADRYCPMEFRDAMDPWDLDGKQLREAVTIFLNSNNSDEAYRIWEDIQTSAPKSE